MIHALSTYVPQDRCRALARGETLPNRTTGSALFADISGFTPLTGQLTQTLGARRGIEELTQRINRVYDALIGQVERYHGSVIGFAGDAVTCWFEAGDGQAAARSVACAQAMQSITQTFEGLSVKVAITSGPARRWGVGDPAIQLIDTLAGATVARLATAEHLAKQDETLLDAATVAALANELTIREWRGAESGERFAVLASATLQVTPSTAKVQNIAIPAETLKPWLLPAVSEREQSGHGAFLTELRPTVALFLRFSGLDYDDDEQAGEKLDSVIRRAQSILNRFEGALLQLTIGDKGSYLYASFGAPIVHEDDANRAIHAALALKRLSQEFTFLQPVETGISSGTMRTGACGGSTRRTYGALGDDVNLAARLMTTAAPGEILVSGRVQKVAADTFTFEPRPPLPLKGKAEPLPVFAVTGLRRQRAIRLEEPHYTLPTMGRQAELALIDEKLELALQGKGQVIGITAEAGLGKSRLVAEAIRLAHKRGFTGYGGACESSGTNTAYLVWRPIWQAFYNVDPAASPRRQIRSLEGEIKDRAPPRVQAIPVLASLLDIAIEDNDFTRTLEPQDRRNVLAVLLEDCLKSAAAEEPLLFVLEDLHWLDPLSHDLLETLARVSVNLPVCFVLPYRPPELARLQAPRVEALPHFTRITLNALTAAEAEQLIRAKLALLFPERTGALPKALAAQLTARAEGNPFFIEELLNYLRDRGLDPYDERTLNLLELPTSLHALILSRIDQLTEPQKVTLKTASVIGRLFRVAWLHGYYPALGEADRVKADLSELARLDLTPLDTPEPELAYLFKHIVTHEVAYESLPHATRTRLHEQLAQFIETLGADKYPDLIAYHYGLSENTSKQREYFQKAGDAAKAAYANEAALDYYGRLLPLLTEPAARIDLRLNRGAVLELTGKWPEAEAEYQAALTLGEQIADAATARCRHALGVLARGRGDYDVALDWLERARVTFEGLEDRTELGQALAEIGVVFWRKGEYAQAQFHLEKSLTLARKLGDKPNTALAIHNLGVVADHQSNYAAARTLFQESLTLKQEMNDKRGVSASLNSLGIVARNQGDYTTARAYFEGSLALRREMGDKWGVAQSLNNLGFVAYLQGDYTAARTFCQEGLALFQEMGDKRGVGNSLNDLGLMALNQGDYTAARALTRESLALRQEMGDKWGVAVSLSNLGLLALNQGDYTAARALIQESLALRREIGDKLGIASCLNNLGHVTCEQADYSTAQAHYETSLRICQETGDKSIAACNLAGLAALAAGLGDMRRAARLAAAAETLRASINLAWEAFERRLYERTVSLARAGLSEAEFNTAWAEGEKLTLEEAVRMALS